MEFCALLTAIACWLAYTLYFAYLSLKKGRVPAEGTVCVLMAGQAGLAEWLLRKIYLTGAVLTGRLSVVVAVEPDDGAAGIVKILSKKEEFDVISPGEIARAAAENASEPWVLDIRGMNMDQLRDGPLKSLASY
ncbi:MAG: hypothetical protein ACOY30_12240 [Bacillota bacterium]